MQLRRQLSTIASAAAALLAATTAQAGARAFMPTGEAVAPPPGYTDLCERGEVSCGTLELAANLSTPTNSILATSSIGANGAPHIATTPTESALDAEDSTLLRYTMLRAHRPAIDADFVAAGSWATASASTPASILAAAPVTATSAPVATTAALVPRNQMRLINTVNREVNRDVHKATDFDLYGLLEYWSLPRVINGKMYGDCEDYALEKRRRLMEAGVPASALSMAVAVTAGGESHAVLVVSFESGDWVLDNLTPWATPWEDLNYRWVQRQVAGSASWTTVG